ncbi:iron-containing alcohol dehydrogenase [Shigella flexneri]
MPAAFTGHCSETHVAQLAKESDNRSAAIGVGGRKIANTAKAFARRLHLPFVGIPTISPSHNVKARRCILKFSPTLTFLVLVEPEIVLNAPEEYLLAGIGDMLAKWYEAVVLAPEPETCHLLVRLGIHAARRSATSRKSSEQALTDKQQRLVKPNVLRCSGCDYCRRADGRWAGGAALHRVAAAHSVQLGPTVLPQTEKFLHGTKAAYAILADSALLRQDAVLAQR